MQSSLRGQVNWVGPQATLREELLYCLLLLLPKLTWAHFDCSLLTLVGGIQYKVVFNWDRGYVKLIYWRNVLLMCPICVGLEPSKKIFCFAGINPSCCALLFIFFEDILKLLLGQLNWGSIQLK